ncbi:hypothetical protein DFQ29_006860 [Apophysomyces sp. BC1021]|nr:hypothetical protein DFQ29_006860 [Apophysomyces sp. BC1021]
MLVEQQTIPIPFLKCLSRHGNQQVENKCKQEEIGNYWLTKTIGRGSSGRVKLGIHKQNGTRVAIKMIPRRRLVSSKAIARTTERELAILQLLHHPHLLELHQVFQDSVYIYFVTEYAEGGELFHMLARRGHLSETEAKDLFGQLASALAWCHAHHICHRDLKPENILLDKDRKHVKIADFGMAAMQSSDRLLQTSCGSPHYASPEIIRGKPYYGPATDVWSCGILLYVMLTGHLPFDDEHVGRLLSKIKTGKYRRLPRHLSESSKDLIKRMLMVDPSQRITMEGVLYHPWIISHNSRKLVDELWHDYNVCGPLISQPCDIYGRVWETLKILWRDLDHDQILAALMAHESGAKSLSPILAVTSATYPAISNNSDDDEGSCPSLCDYASSYVGIGETQSTTTTNACVLPEDMLKKENSPSLSVSAVVVDARNIESAVLSSSLTMTRYQWIPCNEKIIRLAKHHAHGKSKPGVFVTRSTPVLGVLQTNTIPRQQKYIKPLPTALWDYLRGRYLYDAEEYPAPFRWVHKAWQWCTRRWAKQSDTIFSIGCSARTEHEAAGKVHQILSEVRNENNASIQALTAIKELPWHIASTRMP